MRCISTDGTRFDIADALMLSFPRSGSTWLRYCLEHCTGRPATNPGPPANNYAFYGHGAGCGHITDWTPCITKMHRSNEFTDRFTGVPMVLLLRDPFEVLPSYDYNDNGGDLTIEEFCATQPTERLKFLLGWYLENIGSAATNDAPLMVIYYEDLLLSPGIVLRAILRFMGIDDSGVRPFMSNYDEHRLAALGYAKHEELQGGQKVNTGGVPGSRFRQHLPSSVRSALNRACKDHLVLVRYMETE